MKHMVLLFPYKTEQVEIAEAYVDPETEEVVPAQYKTVVTTYLDYKSLLEEYSITGSYVDVVSTKEPIYIKDDVKYQLVAIDASRIVVGDKTIEQGLIDYELHGTVTDDLKGWLAENGYEAELKAELEA